MSDISHYEWEGAERMKVLGISRTKKTETIMQRVKSKYFI